MEILGGSQSSGAVGIRWGSFEPFPWRSWWLPLLETGAHPMFRAPMFRRHLSHSCIVPMWETKAQGLAPALSLLSHAGQLLVQPVSSSL